MDVFYRVMAVATGLNIISGVCVGLYFVWLIQVPSVLHVWRTEVRAHHEGHVLTQAMESQRATRPLASERNVSCVCMCAQEVE